MTDISVKIDDSAVVEFGRDIEKLLKHLLPEGQGRVRDCILRNASPVTAYTSSDR